MAYVPSKLPALQTDDGQAIAAYLEDELQRIAGSQADDIQAIDLRPTHAPPTRPRAGMVVYADGVDWNPGSGEGFYTRTIAGVWKRLLDGFSFNPAYLRSYLAGLTLSTAGASTVFHLLPGVAVDSTNATSMLLAAALDKSTGAWVVGSGVGGLDTGAIAASTWYHVYLIKRPDTGVVDVCISLSATAPTFGASIPAAYTLFRRIGSMKTNSSSQWISFTQWGDEFLWVSPILDVNVTNTGTSAVTRTLSTPPGVQTIARMNISLSDPSSQAFAYFSPLATADLPPTTTGSAPGASMGFNPLGIAANNMEAQISVLTDTNSAIRSRNFDVNANAVMCISTLGWTDRRGRDA